MTSTATHSTTRPRPSGAAMPVSSADAGDRVAHGMGSCVLAYLLVALPIGAGLVVARRLDGWHAAVVAPLVVTVVAGLVCALVRVWTRAR